MALIPTKDNLWGVTIYTRPFREQASLHTPFARQRKKMENMILIKEIGPNCKYAEIGNIAILEQDNGGTVITIMNGEQLEHRFCVNEDKVLAYWTGELPEGVTEAGIINLED